jgi:hypothetical protein
MQALKASLLEPLLALHDATSDFALASAALTQLPIASFGPYFAMKTTLPSAFASALQNADATLAAPPSPFDVDGVGLSGVLVVVVCESLWTLTHAPNASVAPYFALNASGPSLMYSALHAAVAGSSPEVVVVVVVVTVGACS